MILVHLTANREGVFLVLSRMSPEGEPIDLGISPVSTPLPVGETLRHAVRCAWIRHMAAHLGGERRRLGVS